MDMEQTAGLENNLKVTLRRCWRLLTSMKMRGTVNVLMQILCKFNEKIHLIDFNWVNLISDLHGGKLIISRIGLQEKSQVLQTIVSLMLLIIFHLVIHFHDKVWQSSQTSKTKYHRASTIHKAVEKHNKWLTTLLRTQDPHFLRGFQIFHRKKNLLKVLQLMKLVKRSLTSHYLKSSSLFLSFIIKFLFNLKILHRE